MKQMIKRLSAFRPRLLPCGILSLIALAETMLLLFRGHMKQYPPLLVYFLYAAAFLFLCLTVWAGVLFAKSESPISQLRDKLHQNAWAARLVDDPAYRIHMTGYATLLFNLLLALSKTAGGQQNHGCRCAIK